jgi:hypothetical protein
MARRIRTPMHILWTGRLHAVSKRSAYGALAVPATDMRIGQLTAKITFQRNPEKTQDNKAAFEPPFFFHHRHFPWIFTESNSSLQ